MPTAFNLGYNKKVLGKEVDVSWNRVLKEWGNGEFVAERSGMRRESRPTT